ncbi:unnamed protein product [Rotaria sp. Silwood2]|nr:unnamed protein product [Rotaria sp. Silwood2]CAF2560849.1 unnamed protein product [Rotaria sp. Silwood2]CAF3899735.1 unnamed protein product [Rotaria sp. Silwood2]CAF4052437.1 unnamed protein product [Rotaria sp. Silwood2]
MSSEATPVFQMNQKKLKELAESANAIKIGGKGTARRKKKIIHRPANVDDKKLQSSLKKLAANNIPGIEEVNLFKDNGEVIHFANPKVQASLSSNTFAISGASDTKSLQDMLPTIMSQMGMSTDVGLASEAGRRKAGSHGEQHGGEGHTGTINEQEGDDEVPVAIIIETNQFDKNINNTNNNNNNTDSFSTSTSKRVLNEHLKIISTISCISVGIMVVIVVTYLTKRYFNYRRTNVLETSEHTVPLAT